MLKFKTNKMPVLSKAKPSALKKKSMEFTRNPKSKSALSYADENRKQERCCDIIIKSESERLFAHKVILSCFSKYFESMFANETSENYETTVEIKDLDSKAVKLIVDYCYTGCIVVDSDNVLQILAAASDLEIEDVKTFCFDFLESGLTLDTCVEIIAAYNYYRPQASLKDAYRFLNDHFHEIYRQENFLKLSIDDLKLILVKLDKTVIEETSKYAAIFKWIKHDEKSRGADLPVLFKFVDLFRINLSFLENVAAEPLIKTCNDCLNEVLQCYISRNREIGFKILCLGGNEQGSVVEIPIAYGYSSTSYPNLPLNVSRHGALVCKASIYSVGGLIKEKTETKKVFQLKLQDLELKWKEVSSLKSERSSFGASVFKGQLVVAGGFQKDSQSKSVEVYNLQINKWRLISSLNVSRSNVALVSCPDCIIAVGGHNGFQPCSSVERLSDLNEQWELIAPMSIPRYMLAAVCFNKFVYAIGGYVDCNPERSVERYSLDENKWSTVASMLNERAGHSACVMLGKIIVVGGHNLKGQTVREIESYDPIKDSWSVLLRSEYDFDGHATVVV